MVFNNEDFIDFLEFYKNPNNFDFDGLVFDSITNISKSFNSESLVDFDEIKMFNLDLLAENVFNRNNPATCDGINFIKGKLFLAEFKTVDFDDYGKNSLNHIYYSLKDQCDYPNNSCPISKSIHVLERLNRDYSSNEYNNLILKPSESIFFAIPKIYEQYCNLTNIHYNHEEFIAWLLNVKKELMVVLKNNNADKNSKLNFELYKKSLLKKYVHLKSTVNMESKCYESSNFGDNEILNYFK